MTKHPLIYADGPRYILLDPDKEIRIGTYRWYDQAMRAWMVYDNQGRQATGFEYSGYDWYVTNRWNEDRTQFITSKCRINRG